VRESLQNANFWRLYFAGFVVNIVLEIKGYGWLWGLVPFAPAVSYQAYRTYRSWRPRKPRGVRPGDSWTDGRGIRHVLTERDLRDGDGFDI
jgi:hypothetical protein